MKGKEIDYRLECSESPPEGGYIVPLVIVLVAGLVALVALATVAQCIKTTNAQCLAAQENCIQFCTKAGLAMDFDCSGNCGGGSSPDGSGGFGTIDSSCDCYQPPTPPQKSVGSSLEPLLE